MREGVSCGGHLQATRWHCDPGPGAVHRLPVVYGGLPLWRPALQLGGAGPHARGALPTLLGGAIATPAQIVPVLTMNTPSLVAGAAVVPGVISPSITINTPTLAGGGIATPSSVTVTLVVPLVTIVVGDAVTTLIGFANCTRQSEGDAIMTALIAAGMTRAGVVAMLNEFNSTTDRGYEESRQTAFGDG